MSYKQKPTIQKEPELTPRIKFIKESYDKANIEYILNGDDYHEIEFYTAAKVKKPQVFIPTIYRLKTRKEYVVNEASDEVIVYWKQQSTEKYNGQIIQDDRLMGVYHKPITQPKRDAEGNTIRWDKIREVPFFTIPFSPNMVDKIIEESAMSVNYFYVGTVSVTGGINNVVEGDSYRIHNLEDFKNGTFQELMDMGAYNYSTREPSLLNWRGEGEEIKKQNRNIRAQTQNPSRRI